jgi:hypothetical protein
VDCGLLIETLLEVEQVVAFARQSIITVEDFPAEIPHSKFLLCLRGK